MSELPRPFSRRLDPEEQKPLEWVWRRLFALHCCQCVARGGWASERGEWHDDVGYCLDRWSHVDLPARSNTSAQ